MIGTGCVHASNSVQEAVKNAIRSQWITPADLASAKGYFVNVRASSDYPIALWLDICEAIEDCANPEAECKFSLAYDEELHEGDIFVTIVLAGLNGCDPEHPKKNKLTAAPGSYASQVFRKT